MSKVTNASTARKNPAAETRTRQGRKPLTARDLIDAGKAEQPRPEAIEAAVQAVTTPEPDPTLAGKTHEQLLRYVLGFDLGQGEPIKDAAADAWTLCDGAEAMDSRQLQRVTFALARRLEAIAVLIERDEDQETADRKRAVQP